MTMLLTGLTLLDRGLRLFGYALTLDLTVEGGPAGRGLTVTLDVDFGCA